MAMDSGVQKKWIIESTRDEYMAMLVDAILPVVNETIQKLYVREEGSERTKKFQHRLRTVRYWNTLRVQEEVNKISARCGHIRQLLTAVMFAFVRLMTCLHHDAPAINLQVPTLEKFVHTVYDSVAEHFYEHLDHWKDATERRHQITRLIIRSVKKFLPMDEILQAFLGAHDDKKQSEPPSDGEGDDWRENAEMATLDEQPVPVQPMCVQPMSEQPMPVQPMSPVPVPVPMSQPQLMSPAQPQLMSPAQPQLMSPAQPEIEAVQNPPDDFFSDADDEL